MNKIPSFPKIYSLGKKEVETIFATPVEITEKVDGSQFSFGRINNELIIRTKNTILPNREHNKQFNVAFDYVTALFNANKLPNNTQFYCEYLKSRKHNMLAYERPPKNNLILFAVREYKETGSVFVSQHSILEQCGKLLAIDVVPLLFHGKVDDLDQIKKLMQTKSILGNVEIEGVVIKNYSPAGIISAKYVSDKFKERREIKVSKINKQQQSIDEFKLSFRTIARWQKGVQHLRDSGELEQSPTDIGKILKEINHDIEREEEETIKDFLYKMYKGDILKAATNGFAQWYKEQLARKQKF